jgi:hypothetical protein
MYDLIYDKLHKSDRVLPGVLYLNPRTAVAFNSNGSFDRRNHQSSVVRNGSDRFVVARCVQVINWSTLIRTIHVGHSAKGTRLVFGFRVDENVANVMATTIVLSYQCACSCRINVVHSAVPLVFSNGSGENRSTEVQRIDSVVLVVHRVPGWAIRIRDRANVRRLRKVDVVVHGFLDWVCSRLV